MDPSYEADGMEMRTLFGLKMEQRRNDAVIDAKLFDNVTSKNKSVCFPALGKYDCKMIDARRNFRLQLNWLCSFSKHLIK